MRKAIFVILILIVAVMPVAKPAKAMGWKTWVLSAQEEKKVVNVIKASFGDRYVEVTFVDNDLVASCVNCVTGNDKEYMQLKVYSSGYVKVNWPGADQAFAEKVRGEVQKIFTERGGTK